jgi:putative AlgH/UPF0301 family transcriptional regulator
LPEEEDEPGEVGLAWWTAGQMGKELI